MKRFITVLIVVVALLTSNVIIGQTSLVSTAYADDDGGCD